MRRLCHNITVHCGPPEGARTSLVVLEVLDVVIVVIKVIGRDAITDRLLFPPRATLVVLRSFTQMRSRPRMRHAYSVRVVELIWHVTHQTVNTPRILTYRDRVQQGRLSQRQSMN